MENFFRARSGGNQDEELGGQMSFLEHLDELRTRLIRSIIFVIIAAMGCWFASGYIYAFLAAPVERALADAQLRKAPIGGLTGGETIVALSALKEGESGRYVFNDETKLGTAVI